MHRSLVLPVALSAALVAACGSSGESKSGSTASSSGAGGASSSASGAGASGGTGGTGGTALPPIGGARPVTVEVPSSYTAGTAAPLLILLHGYGASGVIEDIYLGVGAEAAKRGFLYVHPDGTPDATGSRFWNASDACCQFDMTTPIDDSAYLSGLVTEISARYTVDPKRIYFVGHSNGAFMSYRMACDHADLVAAIVSLAGAMPEDASKCAPSEPVSVLEIHGTADMTIAYDGDAINGIPYPGATTSVADWVTIDGCSPTADTSSPNLDLESTIDGAETTVTKYGTGCKAGGHAELWTIAGAGHIPSVTPVFTPDVFDFLLAHPKP